MNVLNHWSDARVAEIAERLGTPTAQRRDDVRRVLYEAAAIPADAYREAVEALREIAGADVDFVTGKPQQPSGDYCVARAKEALDALGLSSSGPGEATG